MQKTKTKKADKSRLAVAVLISARICRQRHIRLSITAFMSQKEHKSNEHHIISVITQRRIKEYDDGVLSEATTRGYMLAVQITVQRRSQDVETLRRKQAVFQF